MDYLHGDKGKKCHPNGMTVFFLNLLHTNMYLWQGERRGTVTKIGLISIFSWVVLEIYFPHEI